MSTEDDDLMERLARIEETIRASDGDAIRARWEFGREILAQRQGKQLPPGLLAEICQQAKISQKEVSRRVRVAEVYDEPELSQLCLSSGLTWTAIVNGLPKKRTKPKQPPKPRLAPTAATLKEADRVEELLAKPDVHAEILSRENDTKGSKRARTAAERQERDAARAQKEQDEERLRIERVTRQRLINGEADWASFTEQLETWADTIRRYLELLDGLPIPETIRLKRIDTELSKLQQRLMELRGRIWPDYQSNGELGHRTGFLDVEAHA